MTTTEGSTTEGRARAAMGAIAATVTGAPPLRLAPAQDPAPGADEVQFGPGGPERLPALQHRLSLPRPGSRLRRRGPGRGRRLRPWLTPGAIAAVVAVLAVALVIMKNIQNDGAVPSSTSTSTGPGGIPRYYAAVNPTTSQAGASNDLLVGDDLTGKTIATFAPPQYMTFASVSGAADDRTFVVLAVDVPAPAYPTIVPTDLWFELKLTPGTTHPATLTQLPIQPRFDKVAATASDEVAATALSGSGQELAIGAVPSMTGQRSVEVFSVATGRLLYDWSTDDSAALVPSTWLEPTTQWPALTWIDGDRALAFTTYTALQTGLNQPDTLQEGVRRLNVSGPNASGQHSGDLMADSQLIWSAQAEPTTGGLPCAARLPLVSADGNTVSCYTLTPALYSNEAPPTTGSITWTLTFLTYHVTARGTVASEVAYRMTKQEPVTGSGLISTLWTSPSGGTLIGEWAVGTDTPTAASSSASGTGNSDVSHASATITDPPPATLRPAHIGVINDGKFTPLRLPAGFVPVTTSAIAW